jgi:plasmid stability protein
MGQILVRNLDDRVIARIKSRAKANRRSTEAEVREILSNAVAQEKTKQTRLRPSSGRLARTEAKTKSTLMCGLCVTSGNSEWLLLVFILIPTSL